MPNDDETFVFEQYLIEKIWHSEDHFQEWIIFIENQNGLSIVGKKLIVNVVWMKIKVELLRQNSPYVNRIAWIIHNRFSHHKSVQKAKSPICLFDSFQHIILGTTRLLIHLISIDFYEIVCFLLWSFEKSNDWSIERANHSWKLSMDQTYEWSGKTFPKYESIESWMKRRGGRKQTVDFRKPKNNLLWKRSLCNFFEYSWMQLRVHAKKSCT